MHRIRASLLALQASLWFLPSLILCLGVLAAVGLVELHGAFDIDLAQRWPRVFGSGAEGARGMLSAIATSMITVAGVVFSITVVALSLAASQYSPRVLRNFMDDRPTQTVLGAFVAIFAYCLIVLRTIRGPEEGAFVPSLAVLGGVLMAFVGVFLLIYFVHHVATSIQVASILARIADETEAAIARLFPQELGVPEPGASASPALPSVWHDVASPCSGYLIGVDSDALLAQAETRSIVIRIVPRVGEFLVEGLPMLQVAGGPPPDAACLRALCAAFRIGRQRTIDQDAPFGLQQIVDIALKALSPGIHDPTTAVSCIDQLAALMASMGSRRVPGPYRSSGGALRVIAEGPDFGSMLALSFDTIGEHAGDHAEVYGTLLLALGRIAAATQGASRRALLARQVDRVVAAAARQPLPAYWQDELRQQAAQASSRIAAVPA